MGRCGGQEIAGRKGQTTSGRDSAWGTHIFLCHFSVHVNTYLTDFLLLEPVSRHAIKAFVDSGAQSTIMSAACARRCDLRYGIGDSREKEGTVETMTNTDRGGRRGQTP